MLNPNKLVTITNLDLKRMNVWNALYAACWKYRTQKIAILAPSHNFVGLYLHSWGMYQQSEKILLNIDTSSTCPHNMVNFGLLTVEICWRVWGTPSNFNVTARHSSSGRQPNFAALNRGRHLYSAGRPSRWALAHVLVLYDLLWRKLLYSDIRMCIKIINGIMSALETRPINRPRSIVQRSAIGPNSFLLRQGGYLFVVVCLSVVCLSASNFVQKLPNEFAWNFR